MTGSMKSQETSFAKQDVGFSMESHTHTHLLSLWLDKHPQRPQILSQTVLIGACLALLLAGQHWEQLGCHLACPRSQQGVFITLISFAELRQTSVRTNTPIHSQTL